MLKAFFEIVRDDGGRRINNTNVNEVGRLAERPEAELTQNYKAFKTNDLNIYRDKGFVYEHCGNHSVIYVSFKPVGDNSYRETVKQFKLAISKAFEENRHVLGAITEEEDKAKFLRYLDTKNHDGLTVPEAQTGLTFLARVLNYYYGKKPIVLFDDYDAPVLNGIYNSHKEIVKTVEFIRVLYSYLLIENRNVDRCVISASNVKLAKILSVYTNYDRYYPMYPNEFEYFPFLSDSNISQFFGLTSTELNEFKVDTDQIENWYGGFTVSGQNVKLFNLFSVVQYLKNGSFGSFWVEADGVKHLKEIFLNPQIQRSVDKLLSGGEIILNDSLKLNTDYVLSLQRLFKKPLGHKLVADNVDYANIFIHFLTDNGYFTTTTDGDDIKLRIPNREIADYFAENLHTVTFYVDTFRYDYVNVEQFAETLRSLDAGDPSTFEDLTKSLAELYRKSDVIVPKNDFEFYSPLYVFAKTFGKWKSVEGESHAIGPRGLDVLLIREDGTAIVLQTKYKLGSAVDGLKDIFNNGHYKTIKTNYEEIVIKDKIYIGLHLSEDRKVSVSYLINSMDVNKAHHLSS